ncbi:hypothetical protein CF642_38300 [Burkholderia pseudomallei]|nr:hypothetical protein CF642_38300 [Burkholderia pseudomallei]
MTRTSRVSANDAGDDMHSVFRSVCNKISINSIITLIRLQTLLLDLKRAYYTLKTLQHIQ